MSILKSVIEGRFPEIGKAYRQARSYRRLRQSFQVQKQFGFRFLGIPEMIAGAFEPEEVEIIQEVLPAVDRFVDVGANVGYYACIVRQLGKPVLAFEPLETNLMFLYANLKENGWLDTEVWPVGLADYAGMAPLFGSDTGASLIKGWAKQENPLASAICINRLDTVIGDRFSGERLMLKIDVEGWELPVLRGAADVFDRPVKPVVLLEIALSEHHPTQNPNYRQTFEFFWQRNYRVVTADRNRREVSAKEVESWVKSGSCGWHVHNWLAVPADWPIS